MKFSLINKFWFWVFVSCLIAVAVSVANAETNLIFGQSYFWEDILLWSIIGILFVVSVAIGFKEAIGTACVIMILIIAPLFYLNFFLGEDVMIFVQTFFIVSFIPGMVGFSLGSLFGLNKNT